MSTKLETLPDRSGTPFDLPQPGDLLDENEVAAILAVRVNTIRNWRAIRQGPAFVKIGKRAVRYRRVDVAAFIAAGGAA